jgi:hypothetical protein
MYRRVLYTADRVRAMFAGLKAELQAEHYRHLDELAKLRWELDQTKREFEMLRTAVLQRTQAEADLELLKRDRERTTRISEGGRYWLH